MSLSKIPSASIISSSDECHEIKSAPSTPETLVQLFKKLNPQRSEEIDEMYSWFKMYMDPGCQNPDIELLRKASAALSASSKAEPRVSLRPVQLMNIIWLCFVAHDRSELAQINTGEGKSNIIKMVAALRCLKNPDTLVNIVTTGDTLAKKDAEDPETKAFFECLGIQMTHLVNIHDQLQKYLEDRSSYQNQLHTYANSNRIVSELESGTEQWEEFVLEEVSNRGLPPPPEPPKHPMLARVLYGTPSCFSAALLRSTDHNIGEFFQVRTEKLESTEMIVDEVDSMLVDSKNDSTMLSKAFPESVNLLLLQKRLSSTMSNEIYRRSQESDDKVPMKEYISREGLLRLCESDLEIYAEELMLCNQDKAIFDASYKKWLEKCYMALCKLKEGTDYVIQNGQILIVDHANTGEIRNNSRWESGLHRFTEMKHGLDIRSDNLITNSMSHMSLFQHFKSRLRGLTGTVGNENTRSFLEKTYGLPCYISPPYRPSQLKVDPQPQVLFEKPWTAVVEDSKPKLAAGRIVLTINKDILSCNKLLEVLNSELKPKNPTLKVISYHDSSNEGIQSVLKGLEGNTIIVASNLAGRGTDIEISDQVEAKGGLHVIITFLPQNDRVKAQAEGRAGRKGQKGSAKMIYQVDSKLMPAKQRWNALDSQFHGRLLHIFAKECHANQERMALEAAELEVAYHCMMDKIQSKYTSLLQEFKQIQKCKVSREQLAQDYGLARKQIETKYNERRDIIDEMESWDQKRDQHNKLIAELHAQFDPLLDVIKIKCLHVNADGVGYSLINERSIYYETPAGLEQNLNSVEAELKKDPNNTELELHACALWTKLASVTNNRELFDKAKTIIGNLQEKIMTKQNLAKLTQQQCRSVKNIVQTVNYKDLLIEKYNMNLRDSLNLDLDSFGGGVEDLPDLIVNFEDDDVFESNQTAEMGEKIQVAEAETQEQLEETATQQQEASIKIKPLDTSAKDTISSIKTKKVAMNPTQKAKQIELKRIQAEMDKIDASLKKDMMTSKQETANESSIDDHLLGQSNLLLKFIERRMAGEELLLFNCRAIDNQYSRFRVDPVPPKEEPKPKPKEEPQTGFWGYILGAAAIIGGAVLMCINPGMAKLGLDIIMGGIDLCVENHKMNQEGTYDVTKLVKQALGRALTIAACSNLDGVVNSIAKKLPDSLQKGLKSLHSFQKQFFEHKSVESVLLNRTSQLVHRVTGKMPVSTNLSTSLYALENKLYDSSASAKQQTWQVGAVMFEEFKQQAVPHRVAQIHPQRQKTLETQMESTWAKKFASSLLSPLETKLKSALPSLLKILQNPENLSQLRLGYCRQLIQLVDHPNPQQEYEVFLNSDAFFEQERTFVLNGKMKVLSEKYPEILDQVIREAGEECSLPKSYFSQVEDVGTLQYRLAQVGQRMATAKASMDAIVAQAEVSGATPEMQQKYDGLASQYQDDSASKFKDEFFLEVQNPNFENLYRCCLDRFTMAAIEATPESPFVFTLDMYKLALGVGQNKPREVFCDKTYSSLQQMFNSASRNWQDFTTKFTKQVASILMVEIKKQILDKRRP